MFATTFKTVVSEYGVGIQATTQMKLRLAMETFYTKNFGGMGFGLDALLSRLASEGEAIERSTWAYGALWNSATLSDDKVFLPEEVQLLFSKEDQKQMSVSPSLVYKAESSTNEPLLIPSQSLFFYPKRTQFGEQHSVTTGWAFHTSKKEALAQGYREVIERDLQMLFWHNRLDKYLHVVPPQICQKWLEGYESVSTGNSELYLLQMPLGLNASIHAKGYFTLAIQVSNEAPYLTVGSAVKKSAYGSFQTAMGEMIMLRAYQYEMILTDIREDDEMSYRSHVTRATYETVSRDKVQNLISVLSKTKEKKKLNYHGQAYQVVYLNPPPNTLDGVVAKVWVDGTQGMLPAGFKEYKVCNHWQVMWQMSHFEWHKNVWHPYP